MSDVGRYRKLYTRLWQHPGFAALTHAQKNLAIYMLTGPQTNRLGLYVLSLAQAIEHLGAHRSASSRSISNLKRHCGVVCRAFGWSYDATARVLFIPSWFKWNPPENANVVKGILKDLTEIPSCRLVHVFAANVETLPETLRPTFLEGLPERFRQPWPNQEQGTGTGTENREQDPVPRASARGASRSGAPSPTALSTTRRSHDGNGTGQRELFDAFWKVYPKKVSKDAAWRAWQKRKPSADLTQQICAALAWQRQQDQWLRDGGRFVPNPATWINHGRWQDEPSTTPRVSDRNLSLGRAVQEFLK